MFSPLALAALAFALQSSPEAAAPTAGVAEVTATAAAPTPPPHGFPEIHSMWISTTDPHAGQTVFGRVETSSNVPYVEARILYYNAVMHRDGDGKFSLAYKIPWWLPPWLRHGWDLQVIARSIDGVETKKIIPIHLH